ncbi:MAG: hypothetical protein WCJ35_12420 [Planctomycetota bacterium]
MFFFLKPPMPVRTAGNPPPQLVGVIFRRSRRTMDSRIATAAAGVRAEHEAQECPFDSSTRQPRPSA